MSWLGAYDDDDDDDRFSTGLWLRDFDVSSVLSVLCWFANEQTDVSLFVRCRYLCILRFGLRSFIDRVCKYPGNEWFCDDKTHCIQKSSFCNGRVDCNDHSDEAVCNGEIRQYPLLVTSPEGITIRRV